MKKKPANILTHNRTEKIIINSYIHNNGKVNRIF